MRTDKRRENQRYGKQKLGQATGIGIAAASIALAPITLAGTLIAVGGSALGSVVESYASKDYEVNSQSDYVDLAVSGVIGGALGGLPHVRALRSTRNTTAIIAPAQTSRAATQTIKPLNIKSVDNSVLTSRAVAYTHSNAAFTSIANRQYTQIPIQAIEATHVNTAANMTLLNKGSSTVTAQTTKLTQQTTLSHDSIFMYGHVKDEASGRLVPAAMSLKGEKLVGLSIVPTTHGGLKASVNEASAAARHVAASRVSPTSVAGVNASSKTTALLSKEQPWNIQHDSHLWKGKIIGLPQKTGPKETLTSILNPHAKESARIAIELAKDPNVEKVFLNRGIKKASGHPIQGSNRRPDVTYVTKDGKVHQIEVQSRTDNFDLLNARMEQTRNNLPEHLQGEYKTIKYEDYMRAIDK